MSERDYRNYFGQTAQPFVIVSQFELAENFLRIVFDGFSSIEQFNAGDDSLPNLRREFFIDGQNLAELKRNHFEIFDSIKMRVLEIANVPADYELIYLNLLIDKWVLVINASRKTRDDSIVRTKTAPEYHDIIANNLELVSQVLTIAWQYGKINDEWLNQLTEISEVRIYKK